MSHQAIQELEVFVRARYPLLYIVSWEEQRVLEALEEVAQRRHKKVITWSVTEEMTGQAATGEPEESSRALAALDTILRSHEPALFVLRDFHPFLAPNAPRRATVLRRLRDVVQHLQQSHKAVFILSPILELPRELEKEITVIDFPLPDLEELAELMDQALETMRRSVQSFPEPQRSEALRRIDFSPQEREQILKATLGLTSTEAELVFAKCLVTKRTLDIGVIVSEKEQIIRKSGILEYYHATEQFEDIGGLDLVKAWLGKRTRAFSEEARAFGLPAPKGLLLIGVQGCGKSLCCKSLAGLWRLPLLRLDMGQVFGGIIGESEANMRRAIRLAESISPAILWLDELEKGFAGTQSSSLSDAGTTARVFGSFITWLQDKQAPVFVIATANDVSQLPPELLRKGRFDDLFFVDLPAAAEREEIFRIHLRKRRRDPELFDLKALAEQAAGFSGAEIEQAIIAAMFDAFDAGREVTTEDIQRNLTQTYPLSQTMGAQIQALRRWARTRARPASSQAAEEPAEVDGNEDEDVWSERLEKWG